MNLSLKRNPMASSMCSYDCGEGF